MSNDTELSDSTLPDGFFDDGSITFSEISSIVSTTPLISKSKSHFQLSTKSPTSTPTNAPLETTINTPTSGEDYLRQNVRVLMNQLTSLKKQLIVEDKYFAACVDEYENVISNLRDEIDKLKKSRDAETVQTQNSIAELQIVENIATRHSAKLKDAVSVLANDFVAFVQKFLKTDENALADSGVDFDAQFETEDPRQLTETFAKCFDALDKIVDDKSRTIDELSSRLQIVDQSLSDCRLESGIKDEEIEKLKEKTRQLSDNVDDLSRQLSNLKEIRIEKDDLQSELKDKNEEIDRLSDQLQNLTRQLDESRQNLARVETENGVLLEELDSNKSELVSIKENLADKTEHMIVCQNALDSLTEDYNKSKLKFVEEKEKLCSNLSICTRNWIESKNRVDELSKENERMAIEIEVLKTAREEPVKCLNDLRTEMSSLILENSKLKEELNNLKLALESAGSSSERMTTKFDELNELYSSLNVTMKSKEMDLRDLQNQKSSLESSLSVKNALLSRLVDNFNELSSIFANPSTTNDWRLTLSSSIDDASESFLRLKHRLLGLSRDYIALTRKYDASRGDFDQLTDLLKRKESEIRDLDQRWENKCGQLKIALDNLEAENKTLNSQNIDKDDAICTLKGRIESMDALASKGCQNCVSMKEQVQELKLDIVNKDSSIATLKFHIQSCCDYNRSKALKYKHEAHKYKRQLEHNHSYRYDFGLSPKRNSAPKVDVGLQIGDSYVNQLSGGFVEKFKIHELMEKVSKLEKERTVLKRLCKIRTDRIQELETKYESPPSSSTRSPRNLKSLASSP